MFKTIRAKFKKQRFPADFTEEEINICKQVQPYTKTSLERLYALIQSVRHLNHHGVPGAFVECGVYMGGSTMAMAATLKSLGVLDRELYLFDTFEGMPPPCEKDVSYSGSSASKTHQERESWDLCSLEDVKKNFSQM